MQLHIHILINHIKEFPSPKHSNDKPSLSQSHETKSFQSPAQGLHTPSHSHPNYLQVCTRISFSHDFPSAWKQNRPIAAKLEASTKHSLVSLVFTLLLTKTHGT